MVIRTANQYFREKFGCKVYKISIDGGFTCPNRDGSLGEGGCIFCSAGGSGDFAENRNLTITEQLRQGKAQVEAKLPRLEEHRYLAYFQAFTNTYGPVEKLREKYREAIDFPEVAGLSIATRPDCLSQPVVDLLAECNQSKPLMVELGLQTIHEKTAAYIRRGYSLSTFEEAMGRLKEAEIPAVVHVILGLPGESRNDMLETVDYVGRSGASGIKLQLLHVLKGTDLCREYEKGIFRTLDREEYIDLVVDCLKLLPEEMVIHRMTGDGDKRSLVAPLWSGDKKQVLNRLNKAISEAKR